MTERTERQAKGVGARTGGVSGKVPSDPGGRSYGLTLGFGVGIGNAYGGPIQVNTARMHLQNGGNGKDGVVRTGECFGRRRNNC